MAIKNRGMMGQVKDFSTLPVGATDVDGMIEWHNRCFIFMESKFGDKELPLGQRLALERVVKALSKPSIVFIGTHESPIGQDIDYGNLIVREYYFNGKWDKYDKPILMCDAVRAFLKGYG